MKLIAIIVCFLGVSAGVPASDGWRTVNGALEETREVTRMLLLRPQDGRADAVCENIRGARGAWRCLAQPSLGVKQCGFWFQAARDLRRGFRCELNGGFILKDADGKVLWADELASWSPYQAFVLEGIVEKGRVRVQMLQYDRRTLLSQSDWVSVPAELTEHDGCLAVSTEKGVVRFREAERSETPLVALTDDAPNKRRLAQGSRSEWRVLGTGNWTWADAGRTRIRQQAQTERAWALNRAVHGSHRVWRCSVRVSPDAGGAGMLFQVDERSEGGFNCWLGGKPGAGSLILYRNGGPGKIGKSLYSGKPGKWHFNEDLMLEGETKPGKVRARLLKTDGKTVISETPWITVPPEESNRAGFLAFHTWKGGAEFWGFADGTTTLAQPSSPLGSGWMIVGDGDWQWVSDARTTLRQTAKAKSASCLTTAITGAKGTWRCLVTGENAGLLFQANRELKEGFLCVLGRDTVRLFDLSQPDQLIWESTKFKRPKSGACLVEGIVATDRVSVRLLTLDGTVLAESSPVWISDTNNDRQGHLGFAARGGPAEFSAWTFTPEK